MEQYEHKFKTVRQTAALRIISERNLRERIARGKCPGIKVGNRFMVNVDALLEMLDKESLKAVNQ